MIIDVHAHLGWDQVFDDDFKLEELLEKHQQFQVAKTIIQPGSCHELNTVQEQHNRIAQVCRKLPGQFYGMANPNPHLPDELYEKELRRCIEDLGFVGVKLHTSAHAVNPSSKDGRKVFELAARLNIPVMVHTGAGIPFANPSNLLPVAKQYPDVKIIIAHCGMMIMAGETPIVMEACSNVYADITWTAGFMIRRWSEIYGADRFMFGTDHADNTGTELAKVRTCGLDEESQEWVLYKTAAKVYGI